MPIHVYECEHCGYVFEKIFTTYGKVPETSTIVCPKCEKEGDCTRFLNHFNFKIANNHKEE
jgi:putative FmdB family regulatory protein